MTTSLTLRNTKGSALTFTEVDDNFTNLQTTADAAKTTADAAAVAGAIGSSGLTMATGKLLGRTTASTGAVQEITAGSGLSLSSGQLEVNFAGYLTTADAATTYQPLDGDLTAIAGISGTSGLLKKTAADTWSLDTSTYLTTSDASSTYLTQSNAASTYQTQSGMSSYLTTSSASSTYQPKDADLTAIAGLSGTSGILTKTAADTWSLDTNTYLTTSSASSTYLTQSSAASTYQTQSGMSSYLTTSAAASSYQPLDGDLTAIAAISTNGILTRTGANTWAIVAAPTGTVVGTTDTQTLTNKTLTAPVISTISNTGTLTLPTSTDTLVGRATTDTLTNKTLSAAVLSGQADFTGSMVNGVNTVSASAVDCSAGNYFIKTATGALTWTVSNVPSSRAYAFILELTNGGTGTQTWFSGIKWPGGTAPTLVASGVDVLGFITDDGGTTWRGVQLMKDSK